MTEICQQYRVEWLELIAQTGDDSTVFDGHAASCAACRLWTRSTRNQITLLESLAPVSASNELDRLVALELAGTESRLARALRSLPQIEAPAALDGRVAEALAPAPEVAPSDLPRSAQTVRTLDWHSAPHVLERLVDEELDDEGANSRRFLGDLPRWRAPQGLEQGVSRLLRRRSGPRRLIAPLAALAAACLVLWVAVSRNWEPEGASDGTYSFRVVRAASMDTLNPFAREIGEALTGGAASAVTMPDPVDSANRGEEVVR